tara:strand:+ start:1244 stop:1729 length:486 start_codon:yes stop_codon:yes gene_type:complete
MVWNKLDTKTLTGTADEIVTDIIEVKKCLQIISNVLASGIMDYQQRFGNTTIDTADNYARRQTLNGAIATSAPRSNIDEGSTATATPHMMVSNVINLSSNEKLVQTLFVNAGSLGAGNPPNVSITYGKWTNTSNQIDILNVYNSQAGDYAADSNLTVFGTD